MGNKLSHFFRKMQLWLNHKFKSKFRFRKMRMTENTNVTCMAATIRNIWKINWRKGHFWKLSRLTQDLMILIKKSISWRIVISYGEHPTFLKIKMPSNTKWENRETRSSTTILQIWGVWRPKMDFWEVWKNTIGKIKRLSAPTLMKRT